MKLNLTAGPHLTQPLPTGSLAVTGAFVDLDNERCYRIANSHLMPDFLMTVASPSDHWMFLSSRGAVTAGRKNPDTSLFPYYSADKIIDAAGSAGPLTLIRGRGWNGRLRPWEPFSKDSDAAGAIRRNLYKNGFGNKVYLEEINDRLGLTFRYRWTFSQRFGFVRTCWLTNHGGAATTLELLDGFQNLVPYGLTQDFQLHYSNLGDAYKKNERLPASGLGIYYLSSIPTDRAEPSEGLRATVVWQTGLPQPTILLSERQLSAYCNGLPVNAESDIRAARGAFLAITELQLEADETTCWHMVADVALDQTDVANLDKQLFESPGIGDAVTEDIERCQQRLLSIVSACDGRQLGSDELAVQRHQMNTLFNVMRGGYPSDGYQLDVASLAQHMAKRSPTVYQRNRTFLDGLGERITESELNAQLVAQDDPDLVRLGLEYLPLTFGRRHGDPTRPWNKFSIDLQNPDGSKKISYQGNWRDIFQNWEALALSFPMFASNMVFRFVNASTADGYNPYRLTHEGFEWESPEPDNPWSNIGYWGDHQIIYLLKLLQWSHQFNPEGLDHLLNRECCVYAEIPYRIRGYDDILRDPHQTIDFDFELDAQIADRVQVLGTDGKLLRDTDGDLYRATLGEKLLVPMLAKMTNFVPDGGIWLNTQRPEWNDANNAIVGNGLSIVTVCYLRRYFAFLIDWFSGENLPRSIRVSREIAELLDQVVKALEPYLESIGDGSSDGRVSNQQRRQVLDQLATAGSRYRERLYTVGLSGDRIEVALDRCVEALRTCLQAVDATIRSNRRQDGLYESYNLLSLDGTSARIEPLYEMLEGQVAVLSSGLLAPREAVAVLDALRRSRLYRSDQDSFMLYPDRELPRFVDKNNLPADEVFQSELLGALLADGDRSIVRIDDRGGIHFCGDFRNRTDLDNALDRLSRQPAYADLVDGQRESVNKLFELTFNHRSFTGRSGTFFGYEGLGSIYWHMVSKLALASIENYLWIAADDSEVDDETILPRLRQHYRQIRAGIGVTKSPAEYGAFPVDPYSHTPKHAGAQQPGMTGQVKEDILTRFAEVGVRITSGILYFDPVLFETHEFLQRATEFVYCGLDGQVTKLPLAAGSFAFTFCQTPIVYRRAESSGLVIYRKDLPELRRGSLRLSRSESAGLFRRLGAITKIEVLFPCQANQ